MRTVGIDHGKRWFGLAISDPRGRIAHPLERVEGEERTLNRLSQVVAEEDVARFVLGLPRNMDGSLGPKAEEVLRFAGVLRERFSLPVEPWDERLTTQEAERALRAAGLPRKSWGKQVNQVAAQIILQSYLDAHWQGEPPSESEEIGPDPGDS